MSSHSSFPRPLLGFSAWSGTGKTTLLKALLPRLKARGLRIACIKHAHHDFDVDQPGKDSHTLRHAGADQMLVVSDRRWALMVEAPRDDAPSLKEMLQHLNLNEVDLVLVEGFKAEAFPKLELHRMSVDKPWRFPEDPQIRALATDCPDQVPEENLLPVLDLNDLDAIEAWVLDELQRQQALSHDH